MLGESASNYNRRIFKYFFLIIPMKKAGILFALMIVFSLTLITVSAQNQTVDEKAVDCLKSKVKGNCDSLTIEQQVFSILGLADNSAVQSECKSALLDKQSADNSWNQNIKDTSLAIIALNYIKANVNDEVEWLLSKKKTADLEWYLEIDASTATQCEVEYDTVSKTINIGEDRKISGNLGNCLSLAYGDYWLKISDKCFDKTFKVSCDQNFVSTTLYKKPGSDVWYISSDSQSTSSGGTNEHTMSSYCFGSGKGCDYEESLWATLALSEAGEDITDFLPYLLTYSEDNRDKFPSSFLYMLTNSEEYLNKISTLQRMGEGNWRLSQDEYYDTALALLSLYPEIPQSSFEWLEENQDNNGCWNNGNIRDTGFLLWAAYPKKPYISGEKNYCEPTYYCTTQKECEDAGGKVLDYICSGMKICCNTPPKQKTCEEMEGEICADGEICDGITKTDSEGNSCCLGNCVEEKSECEKYGYSCKTSCAENEEKTEYSCPWGKICCKQKLESERSYWWIWLLIILIILVVLGIIFRNKLRMFIFRLRGGKIGPVAKTRPVPPVPPAGLRRMFPTRMMPRPIPRQTKTGAPTLRKPKSAVDRELEETLKKLKEIGK